MEQQPANKRDNKKIGNVGELICAKHYQDNGFLLIDMNYRQKWGEIDVIAKYGNKIHFVEVKSVSYETKADLDYAVAHGTWRPEENVHLYKQRKLSRAIQTWILEYNWQGDIQIDVATARLVPRETYATIKIIENVILE